MRIEAMISTAYEYYGDTYKACYSQAPGGYVDCSGLAMQGLYAAGFDPWPVSPERHSNPAYEYESRNMWNLPIQRVSYSDRQRGDLIYYDNGYGTIIHVAIYLGDDKVIEAWPPSVTVMPTVNGIHPPCIWRAATVRLGNTSPRGLYGKKRHGEQRFPCRFCYLEFPLSLPLICNGAAARFIVVRVNW